MLLKDIRKLVTGYGKFRTFDGKRVFYTKPEGLSKYLSDEDWHKIRDWNGICIYTSSKNKPNKCFYFYWGYGGTPESLIEITIKEEL